MMSLTVLVSKFLEPPDKAYTRSRSVKMPTTDDLDEAGSYKLQGKVVISDGTFYTDITTFKVHRNL